MLIEFAGIELVGDRAEFVDKSQARHGLMVVLVESAFLPLAVLLSPVVLEKSALIEPII
jgi:hypothetical protein